MRTIQSILKLPALLFLLGCLILSACDKDRNLTSSSLPQLYLGQLNYTVGKNPIRIKLTAQQAPSQDLQISYRLSGTAILGTDYSVSSETFTLEAGKTEAILTITPSESLTEQKTLQVALTGTPPTGYQYGLKDYSLLRFLGENGYLFSFAQSSARLDYINSYSIRLDNIKGGRFRASENMNIALEVDPSSTAVLGEHFEFVGDPSALVRRNRNEGSFQLKFLKWEEGKDQIVLRFADRDGFAEGQNGQLSIQVDGPAILAGSWKLATIVNKSWLEDPNNGFDIKVSEMIDIAEGDQIRLIGGPYDYQFTSTLSGKLSNYFPKTADVRLVNARNEVLQEVAGSPTISLNLYEFSQLNVTFSAERQTLRKGTVGLRLVVVDGEEKLECTIYDFEPLAPTWKNVYDIFGAMTDVPLRLYFTRIDED